MDNEELQEQIDQIRKDLNTFKQQQSLFGHKAQLTFPLDAGSKQVIANQVQFPVPVRLQDTAAATAANYGEFFIADKSYRVVSIVQIHGTKGTDASAVTLNVEKLTGTTAPDSGSELLSTAFNLKGTDETVQYGTLVTSDAVFLGKGDRLCLKDTGTLTSLKNVVVTVYIQSI